MTLTNSLFMALLVMLPLLFVFLIICQHILGAYLSRKYDSCFFKEPFFSAGELINYSSWPLSLLKFATYIQFTAFPRTLQDKRFQGFPSPYKPSVIVKIICQLWMITLIAGIVATPTIIAMLFFLVD